MLQGVCAEKYMHAKAASKIHSNAHGDPELMSSFLSGTRKLLCTILLICSVVRNLRPRSLRMQSMIPGAAGCDSAS